MANITPKHADLGIQEELRSTIAKFTLGAIILAPMRMKSLFIPGPMYRLLVPYQQTALTFQLMRMDRLHRAAAHLSAPRPFPIRSLDGSEPLTLFTHYQVQGGPLTAR